MKTKIQTLIKSSALMLGASVLISTAQAGQGPQPTICVRSCWGARAPKCGISQMGALTRGTIHHTAGAGDYTTSYTTAQAVVRSIQNYHMDSAGMCDIAYHFLTSAGGDLFEGRSGSMSSLPRGGHDGCNTDSFGFNVMGYYHPPYNQLFTGASRDSLEAVIAWRMPSAWSPYGSGGYCSGTEGTLVGHYEVYSTACPGDGIIPQIPGIRDGVNERKNPTPRIDVFFRDAANGLGHKYYSSVGGWSGFEALGGTLAGKPTVCSWTPGRLDVFARGTDNTLQHRYCISGVGWSAWESLGGIMTSDPTAVSWGSGRIDVFFRGTDNGVWHKYYVSGVGWSAYAPLGGSIAGAPDVCSWGVGRLDIFARGTDNTLHHKYYNSGWAPWGSLGGGLTADPAVTSWGPNRIDVFVRGGDGGLWQRYFNNGWAPWSSLGGSFLGSPDVCSWGVGRLDVFVRGNDNSLVHRYYNNGWSVWEFFGGVLTSDPGSVSWTSGN